MFKPSFPLLLIASILLLLAGCDGHSRTLYVRAEGDKAGPWSVGATTLFVHGSPDVPALVAEVAASLALDANKSETNCYSTRPTSRNVFHMCARQDEDGQWRVALMDWPTIKRSDVSRKAEQLLRGHLAAPR